jgi:hypothetical protein
VGAESRKLAAGADSTRCNTQPARPRLNSVVSLGLTASFFDPDQWLPEGTTIGEAYEHIFGMLGIPDAAVTDYTSNEDAFELLTGEKPAWPTLVDMADYTNTLIAVDYLNNIVLLDNLMWDTAVVSGGETTFDRSTASRVTLIQERPGAVKQVKMDWVNTDGSAGGTIVYPDPSDVPWATTPPSNPPSTPRPNWPWPACSADSPCCATLPPSPSRQPSATPPCTQGCSMVSTGRSTTAVAPHAPALRSRSIICWKTPTGRRPCG